MRGAVLDGDDRRRAACPERLPAPSGGSRARRRARPCLGSGGGEPRDRLFRRRAAVERRAVRGPAVRIARKSEIYRRLAVRLETAQTARGGYRRAYCEIAKGNGKSPLAAGIGHYCLVADGEMRAEVYAAAADKDQALVLFRDAVAMRDQSPALAQTAQAVGRQPGVEPGRSRDRLVFPADFAAKSARPARARGRIARCATRCTSTPTALIIETLERGFKWRRQPLLVMITNAGSRPQLGVLGRAPARRARRGRDDARRTMILLSSAK